MAYSHVLLNATARADSPAVMVTSAGCAGCTLLNDLPLIVDLLDPFWPPPSTGCGGEFAAGSGINSMSALDSSDDALAFNRAARYCSMWQLLTDICTRAACAGCVAGAFCESGRKADSAEEAGPATLVDKSGRVAFPLLLYVNEGMLSSRGDGSSSTFVSSSACEGRGGSRAGFHRTAPVCCFWKLLVFRNLRPSLLSRLAPAPPAKACNINIVYSSTPIGTLGQSV